MRVYKITFVDQFGEDSMYFNAHSLESCYTGFRQSFPEYTLVEATLA